MNSDIAHWYSAGPLISHLFFKGRGRGRGNLIHLIPEVCKRKGGDLGFAFGWRKYFITKEVYITKSKASVNLQPLFFKYILGFCASFLPPLKFFHGSFGFVLCFFHPLSQFSSSLDEIKINYLQCPNHICFLRTREEQPFSFFFIATDLLPVKSGLGQFHTLPGRVLSNNTGTKWVAKNKLA